MHFCAKSFIQRVHLSQASFNRFTAHSWHTLLSIDTHLWIEKGYHFKSNHGWSLMRKFEFKFYSIWTLYPHSLKLPMSHGPPNLINLTKGQGYTPLSIIMVKTFAYHTLAIKDNDDTKWTSLYRALLFNWKSHVTMAMVQKNGSWWEFIVALVTTMVVASSKWLQYYYENFLQQPGLKCILCKKIWKDFAILLLQTACPVKYS